MKRLSVLALALLGLVAGGIDAPAQDRYPTKPIRILVPYAPGGATDIVGRVLGEELRATLGQSFVIENKPGAFGILAIEQMAHARPDGYTLMIGNVSTNAITPIIYPGKMSIDYEKDVVPVTRLVDVPAFLLAATKDFAPRTFAELLAYAKANPGKVRYGSVGVGSYPHFDAALFAKRAGLDMVHIPNKAGASGVINDMVSGDTQIAFLNVASTASMVKAGQLRPLAVVNDRRLPDYPDVPTMAEVGYAGVGTLAWQGLFAPAGTPKEVLEKLHAAILQAMKTEPVIKAFETQNFHIVPNGSLDEAKGWLAAEIGNWKKISGEVKIEVSE
jgi:tripartite-type tricarboxylate transporter receptor subunit TctC